MSNFLFKLIEVSNRHSFPWSLQKHGAIVPVDRVNPWFPWRRLADLFRAVHVLQSLAPSDTRRGLDLRVRAANDAKRMGKALMWQVGQ